MPVRLPRVPPDRPMDGLAFRWLVGTALPAVRELGAPEHVEDELVAAMACGDATEGFLWMSCDACGVHRLLAALVPPKGRHLVRYHGVLAPASKLRSRVVRCPRRVARWIRWSVLVERTFGADAIRCPVSRADAGAGAGPAGAREVWMWLDAHAERLLVGPPLRAGPVASAMRGGARAG